jgi:hypothetical protein
MTKPFLTLTVGLAAATFFAASLPAQDSTPPASAADKEAAYTVMLEKRADDILKSLALDNPAKEAKIRDLVIAQYRALRARDEAIDAKLKAAGIDADRASLLKTMSKPLHDEFLTKLSADLTREQVETVKDKMTYNKVKVTYDAYCAIVPDLTPSDKSKIMEMLKQAREEAMDGGSSREKSDIFQKYKDQINSYLDAHGHDVAKAYKDLDAKQEASKKQKDDSAPKTAPSVKQSGA